MQNFMKEELEQRSKCSVCWQVCFPHLTKSRYVFPTCSSPTLWIFQATSANWEFVSCLVICVLVWVFCLYLWIGCEVSRNERSLDLLFFLRWPSGDKWICRKLPTQFAPEGGVLCCWISSYRPSPVSSNQLDNVRSRKDAPSSPTDSSGKRSYFPMALQKSSEIFLINSISDCQVFYLG